MTQKEISKQYLNFLEQGDLNGILELFSENGLVSSPIYGTKKASVFYKELFNDTNNSKLSLKGVFEEAETNKIAIYFNYKWTLADKSVVTFDVVDILEFNSKNQIEHLHIIYDTVKSRTLQKQQK
ncbi:nuclear transport factor 2 family protein [Seonamhaeicola maritimus]|uniref:Nuclear transport factor 2 family protein n=1 Tax=Seonamhaeicola maritimus TaxID=2591822 RepID=A0A5C7GG57_9FLAO|nr:nuclear transport factor 2 family protein [Seonamhaeicola maritimus]TXG35631.1 nuclear transport factor 2 family protein [Seonamhaeicola maritimus]